MFLIIEGMDNCGKSTLINSLRKRHFTSPLTLSIHSSSPPNVEDKNEWEYKHYSHFMHHFAKMSAIENYDVIADRFHLGAYVYGKKYRNQKDTIIEDIEANSFITQNRTILVVVVDTNENILSRDDGLSLEQSEKDYDETRELFNEAFKKSKIKNKHIINLDEIGGIENLYDHVMEILNG